MIFFLSLLIILRLSLLSVAISDATNANGQNSNLLGKRMYKTSLEINCSIAFIAMLKVTTNIPLLFHLPHNIGCVFFEQILMPA